MPLFSKSKGHEICQQKNLVAINELFNSDVDIYHLERIALRCVSLHNIFVSFFSPLDIIKKKSRALRNQQLQGRKEIHDNS